MNQSSIHDRYQLEKELGQEGLFVGQLVRLLVDGQTTRLLRRLAPDVRVEQADVRAFIEACEGLSRVDCPNLLTIVEVGIDRDGLYLVTEYPRYVPLHSLLGRIKFPPLQAAMIILQAASALGAAFPTVAHGSLTPRRLLITSTGVIKVNDFGLPLLVQYPLCSPYEKESAYWLDPAVLSGLKPDERSDMYSLGRILLALLFNGSIPENTGGASELEYLRAIVEHVPDGLRPIVTGCLYPDRTKRFPTAKELFSALDRFIQDAGITDSVVELTNFLRQKANGPGFAQSKQKETRARPSSHDHQETVDPSSFWEVEHGVDSTEEGADVRFPELSHTQAQGLLKLSQEGKIQPRQPEKISPPLADSMTSPNSAPATQQRVTLFAIPNWLRVLGGVVIAAAIGGLLGWYLIGRSTVSEVIIEPSLNSGINSDRDSIETINPKEELIKRDGGDDGDGGGDDAGEIRVVQELSNQETKAPQETTSGPDGQSRDQCLAGCGWIYVTTIPPEATVELDGNEVPGTTPLIINQVSANDPHVLYIKLPGMKPYKQTATVSKGEVLNLNIKLK